MNKTRRIKHARRYLAAGCALAMGLLWCGTALGAPADATDVFLSVSPQTTLNPPIALSVSASSAILVEAITGRELFAKDADAPRPMASTTKLMTALLAAETLDPDDTVTATDEAVRVEGTAVGLRAGDTLTVRDLVTGLLLASGNDAANLIALTVCDGLPAFAARMNARARQIGEEFADVMMYGLQLARTLGIDITGQVLRKIDIVDHRPPKPYDPKR